MVSKTFSGNSSYRLDVTASRSGKSITVVVQVTKTAGTGYWTNDSFPYTVVIDGTTYSGNWAYDFRGSTPKTLSVTTRTKSGLGAGSRSWSVNVHMGSGIGSASLSGSITVPYDAPAAPTIGTPVRVSDTRQTVHWTRNATVDGRYQAQQVQRRQYSTSGSWGAWVGVVDIATDYTNSGAMSANDNSTVANRIYEYRVKASNSSGEAYSGIAAQVYTTPGTPSAFSATKTAGGGIKLALTRTTGAGSYRHDIQYSINGGSSWSDLTTLGSTTTEYTWNSPPSGETLVFRVRSRVEHPSVIGNGLTSGWRSSNSVALAAPPNPPSGLSPNGSAFDAGTARTFSWRHNPVDSSPQIAYDLRYRPVGGSWTTIGKTSSGTSSRSFPADTFTNGLTYEWQVRTWGVHDDPSNWSNTATVTFSAPPVATITAPSETLDSSRVTVEWTYHDEETTTQSAWQAELIQDGTVIEARSGSGGATSTTFTHRLADATEYMVRVRVRDGHNLWSTWDQASFTTSFPVPNRPRATPTWDPEMGAVVLAIENVAWWISTVITDTDGVFGVDPEAPEGDSDLLEDTDGIPAVVDGANDLAMVLDVDGVPAVVAMEDAPDEGAVPAVSNDVLRSVDGETWELVATGVAVDALFPDMEAPVGTTVMYKIIAWSDLPSSRESNIIAITTPGDCGYWSAGGLTVRMLGDEGDAPRIDLTMGLASKQLHYFAGRTLPVEIAGVARSRTGAVSFTTIEPSDIETVRKLAYMPAPHLFRAPDAGSVYASIGPVSEARLVDDWFKISVNLTEVEQ